MSGTAIFWPVIVQAIVTLILYVPMFQARMRAVKAGDAEVKDFRLRTHEPALSAQFVNAITNQYETPVLYYAVCLIAFVSGLATPLMVGLAWAYCILKLIHIFIFTSSNRLKYRMPLFAGSLLVLTVMWIVLAILMVLV